MSTRVDLLQGAILPPSSTPILVAVSGGLDSMVLLDALHSAGYPCTVAHVHHGLRKSATSELEMVEAMAQRLGLAFLAEHVVVDRSTASLQAAAREARYEALAGAAGRRGIAWVATGHHADDQAETLLLHLARGAGPAGLAGMRAAGPLPGHSGLTLLRPLLERTRQDLEGYARERGLSWVEDPSNSEVKYRRNALRATVLPAMKAIFGENVSRAIARSASLLRAYQESEIAPMSELLLEKATRPLPKTHLSVTGLFLAEDELSGLSEVWLSRLLLDALDKAGLDGPRDHTTASSLAQLLDSQVGRRIEVGSGEVWRERDGLALVASRQPLELVEKALVRGRGVQHGRLTVRAQSAAYHFETESWCAAAPSHGPFGVRAWVPGDRIAIRDGTAKVKDLLTEAAIPAFSRASHPVVTWEGGIIWIPGVRSAWLTSEERDNSSWVRLSAFMD